MRLLSAINYEDIEEYLNYLPGITAVDAVKDKKSLLEIAGSFQYDLILLSNETAGSEEMEYIIEILTSEEFKTLRVVFIYGEYDSLCDNFIRLLISCGVYDFYVGDEMTSRDLERLIFRPAGKETAFGYLQSHFDNEQYFNYKNQNVKESGSFFSGRKLFNSSCKTFSNTDSYKRAPVEKLIISIISNQATGKSHTAWNLGYCFSKRGYATSLFNIDRGYSANLFFDIDDIYYDLLDFTLQNNMHKDILDNCSKRKNLSIITGKLGDEKEISNDDFLKLLYGIRTKSDITIIDTRTGLSALTRLAVKSSIYDLLVFDCDIMHYHMNMNMLEELKDDFVAEKTIALINNTNVKSSSHKFIYNELKSSGIPFKDIAFICNCGHLGYEVMHTGIVPYQAAREECKEFARDMDGLLEKLCIRQKKNGFSLGIFGR